MSGSKLNMPGTANLTYLQVLSLAIANTVASTSTGKSSAGIEEFHNARSANVKDIRKRLRSSENRQKNKSRSDNLLKQKKYGTNKEVIRHVHLYPAREVTFDKTLLEVIFKVTNVDPAPSFGLIPAACHLVRQMLLPGTPSTVTIEFSAPPSLAARIASRGYIIINHNQYPCEVAKELHQCTSCLRFRNHLPICKYPSRCSHCAGHHHRKTCPNSLLPVKCGNCTDNKYRQCRTDHSPFDRQCPFRRQKQLEEK